MLAATARRWEVEMGYSETATVKSSYSETK